MSAWIKPVAVTLAAMALLGAALYFHVRPAAPARCSSPARTADGAYSAYRTSGTMPSGSSVIMSDGDTWACANGVVTVR